MNEGRELSYEQPLAPGEARLDVGHESVGIAWRLSPSETRGAVVRDVVIVTLLAIGIAMRAYQQHRYAGRIDLGSVWVYGLAACIWLLHLMSDVMQGQATLSVSANEERLAWSTHPWRRERSLPMSEVREFAVEAKPKGYALVVHPQLWRSEHARWYPFASAKSQPIVLLTHTDPVFAYRAAEALNALLAPADDLAATPFLPPPPSPDPPS